MKRGELIKHQNDMKKATIIYEETRILKAKYFHPKFDDYLDYISKTRIKDSGKNPVEMILTFDGIPPFAAQMPPEKHTIEASAILDLCVKVIKWSKRYGYELKEVPHNKIRESWLYLR